jgi:hypothetical protein
MDFVLTGLLSSKCRDTDVLENSHLGEPAENGGIAGGERYSIGRAAQRRLWFAGPPRKAIRDDTDELLGRVGRSRGFPE